MRLVMDKWEKKCRALCREKVMSPLVCEMCRSVFRSEQHHGMMKSDQRYTLNPFYWYDPTLQFRLCPTCHKHRPCAPHVNQQAFEAKMMDKTPVKIQTLQALKQGPLIKIDARTIDWKKVYANLLEHGKPLGNEIFEELM